MTAAIIAAAICLYAVSAAAAAREEAIAIAVPELPREFDPQRAVRDVDLAVASEVFMGLVTHDAQGRLVPGAADHWDISPDGLTYTFTLRRGEQWSDGSLVEAQDFLAGFHHALAPKTAAPFMRELFVIKGAEDLAGGDDKAVLGVTAPDGHTLKITLTRRSDDFLKLMAQPIAMPLPRHRLNSGFERESLASNGAFTAMGDDSGMILLKNPRFDGAKNVALTKVTFVVAASADEADELVRKGEANLTSGFALTLPPRRGGSRYKAETGQDLLFVAVNARKPLLAKRENRHALAMTIDRESLVRDRALDNAVVAYTVVPPQLSGSIAFHHAAYASMTVPMRDAVAEVLLAESQIGPKQPANLELRYPQGATAAAVAQTLAAAWQKIGVIVQLKEDTAAGYADAVSRGDFDLALATWPARAGDAEGYLTPLTRQAGAWNIAGYAEPEFNRRMADLDAEPDPAHRPASLAEAENVVLEDQIILPIVFFTPQRPVNLDGWQANVAGIHPLRFLSK